MFFKFKRAVFIVSVFVVFGGAAYAQDRSRIDIGSDQLDSRSIADTLDKAITVVPAGQPGSGTPMPVSLMMKIEFGFASSGLTPKAMGRLEQVAVALNDPRLVRRRFIVEGHTDSVGSDEQNTRLSQERALSVVSYLQKRGVGAERLAVQGFGKHQPIPGIEPTDGRNRRVEIVPVQ